MLLCIHSAQLGELHVCGTHDNPLLAGTNPYVHAVHVIAVVPFTHATQFAILPVHVTAVVVFATHVLLVVYTKPTWHTKQVLVARHSIQLAAQFIGSHVPCLVKLLNGEHV